MHIKKMIFHTALALALGTLGATAASAQEQTIDKDQVKTEITEAAKTATETATETASDAASTATEAAPAKPAGPEGMWKRRKKNHQVRVSFRDGAMYCTIVNRKKRNGKPKKDFEMCHGMTAEGDAWKGKHMKHPEMPGFMTFKGTVTVEGDVLKIKGCAGICDSEKWDRIVETN